MELLNFSIGVQNGQQPLLFATAGYENAATARQCPMLALLGVAAMSDLSPQGHPKADIKNGNDGVLLKCLPAAIHVLTL
jgi:hypothetical protein